MCSYIVWLQPCKLIDDRLVIMHAEISLVGMQRTAMVRNVTRPLRSSVVRFERRSLTLK